MSLPKTTFDEWVASLPTAGSALPVYCLFVDRLREQARRARRCLPEPFYAVKANMLPEVLQTLAAEGLRKFEFSSMPELDAALTACPLGEFAYMNPVKQEGDIAAAHAKGVRTFVLDSADELDKIVRATQGGAGCTLIVRLALTPKQAKYDMTGKSGASPAEVVALLKRIQRLGLAMGMTFHVGSQCEHPDAYVEAIREAAAVVTEAGVGLSILDVGGGFPAAYSGQEPSLEAFGSAVTSAFSSARAAFGDDCQLRSEPGRSLLAASGSVLVRVELRRGDMLYLNDGVHGLLSELRYFPGLHPVRRISATTEGSAESGCFTLAGPTCDSGDLVRGGYRLPADMAIGDWIEVGFLGAYCVELATPFNGFGRYDLAIITD